VAVKKNQKILYNKIQVICKDKRKASSRVKRKEKNKGRQESRQVYVFKNKGQIDEDWSDVKRVIMVEREREAKGEGEMETETAYYISSYEGSAEEFMSGIRQHWSIENGLHYVKDVTFNEDKKMYYNGKISKTMSVIFDIAINIFRKNGYKYIPVGIRAVCNKVDLIMKVIE